MDDVHNRNRKKTYYVSVQAGQILEDQEAASYEFVIRATNEEITQLQELFEEYTTMDEAEIAHFSWNPYETASDLQMSAGCDGLLKRIYELLYSCGIDETKRHIESMNII